MQFWLMKSEPEDFSIDDLKNSDKKTASWDGVRNYQARNFMRDGMKIGDSVFYYHSNCKEPGIVGLARVVREAYPDNSAWNKGSKYFDEKSSKDNPRWVMVDIKWDKTYSSTLTLSEMKEMKSLQDFKLLQKGNRLSVMPVDDKNAQVLLKKLNKG